jgi:hypothetical protein
MMQMKLYTPKVMNQVLKNLMKQLMMTRLISQHLSDLGHRFHHLTVAFLIRLWLT